jgi:hypothetical protein
MEGVKRYLIKSFSYNSREGKVEENKCKKKTFFAVYAVPPLNYLITKIASLCC